MNNNICSTEYHPFQKFKVLCWYDRMRAIKTGDFTAPVNIAIDLLQGTSNSKKCGKFNCDFCMSNWKGNEEEASIPRGILLGLPEFWNKWGVRSICVAGHHSDPSMYPQGPLVQFLRLCYRFNIEVGFVTNGAYLNNVLMDEISRTCSWCGFSINAGNAEDHQKITRTPPGTFNKIIKNIKYMAEYIRNNKLSCALGYKYLVLDNNYKHIYDGIKLASKIGIRHFQLRPTDLPNERADKIDVEDVEKQIKMGLILERHNDFEVFGIREKFDSKFKKVTPWKCVASPLGSTWKANGNVVICPDCRHTDANEKRVLGNFIKNSPRSIKEAWAGPKHREMINIANKFIDDCHRCTSIQWHNLYREVIENDSMNTTLI